MNILRLLIICIILTTLVCSVNGQQSSAFLVPDSIITLSSQKEVSYDGKVFGMPLWAELPDSAIKQTNDELLENRTSDQNEFGVNRAAWYVQSPSLLFFPAGKDTLHPAVVIFPGGGYKKVVIDKEGIDVAQRLNQSGVSAIVVKYRTLSDPTINYNNVPDSLSKAMYADARQAIKVVREKAAEFNFDPNKIGAMGFSAGGALAANLLVDRNDEVSVSDPDFGCLTYPVLPDSTRQKVSGNTSPAFLVSTKDDGSAPAVYVQEFYDSLQASGVEAEFQLFNSGGHGYGLGVKGGDVTQWPGLFISWLKKNNILITAIENTTNQIRNMTGEFTLYDCFPNPFNPTTTITYSLSSRDFVTLEIYNCLGKKVQRLISEFLNAGNHSINFNANNFSSGIYFYKLQAGNRVETRKMILIR